MAIFVNNYKFTATGNWKEICFNDVSGLAACCPLLLLTLILFIYTLIYYDGDCVWQ